MDCSGKQGWIVLVSRDGLDSLTCMVCLLFQHRWLSDIAVFLLDFDEGFTWH